MSYALTLAALLASLYTAARLNGSTVASAAHLTTIAFIAGLALSA
jgi:hypothetical protein